MQKKNPIDWTQPLKTRGGSPYMLYHVVHNDYCNGAYYDEDSDVWYPIQHDFQGNYSHKKSSLDLVNA
jgi:hypothetical protein